MRKLRSVKVESAHFAALDAAGIDPDAFGEVVNIDAGLSYVMEVEQIADALAGLILSAVTDISTSTAAVNLCRRRVWLESFGFKDAYLDSWMRHPTPSGGGLMGATAERVAAFKAEQASKEVLQKEMAYMYKKPPPPTTPAPAGRGANFSAAAHQRCLQCSRG